MYSYFIYRVVTLFLFPVFCLLICCWLHGNIVASDIRMYLNGIVHLTFPECLFFVVCILISNAVIGQWIFFAAVHDL